MSERAEGTTQAGRKSGKRVIIKSYATINPGKIRFGRSVEEKLFKKKI
jgi:hypothetical protein